MTVCCAFETSSKSNRHRSRKKKKSYKSYKKYQRTPSLVEDFSLYLDITEGRMMISKNEYKYETNRKVNEHIECIRYIQQIISKGNQNAFQSILNSLSVHLCIYLSKHYSTRTGRSRSPTDLKGNPLDVQGCVSDMYASSGGQRDSVNQLVPSLPFVSVSPGTYKVLRNAW